jgi:hypothetical protein
MFNSSATSSAVSNSSSVLNPLRLTGRQMGSAARSSGGEGGPLRAGGVDLLGPGRTSRCQGH